MLDLELATTEQILDELAKRPLKFVFVSAIPRGDRLHAGYIAHNADMERGETVFLLQKAEQFLEEEAHEQGNLEQDPYDDEYRDGR